MKAVKKFCQDKDGKWAIGQFPNIPISIWAVLTALMILMPHSDLRSNLDELRSAVLFAWAYLELAYGDSGFRRVLGGVILTILAYGFFAT